jgi:hypothetical protein
MIPSSPQVTFYVIETNPAESQCGLLFTSRLGDDHDGLGTVEQGARPGGELPTQPDVDSAGNVTLGILGGISHIEDL